MITIDSLDEFGKFQSGLHMNNRGVGVTAIAFTVLGAIIRYADKLEHSPCKKWRNDLWATIGDKKFALLFAHRGCVEIRAHKASRRLPPIRSFDEESCPSEVREF